MPGAKTTDSVAGFMNVHGNVPGFPREATRSMSLLPPISQPPDPILPELLRPGSDPLLEAAWAVMKLEANPVISEDGIPTFTESECTAFCKANGLVLIIRGRQLVDEGFLNYPKEVLTIVSAVAYLDNFRNYAAAITVQGMNVMVFLFEGPTS
ncbi:unnamed protein product [Heligmosomoides polygyrus]|uniref:SER_THR_PHOSPHATASE domain-containing protein n=1 Tax=Heligmosomoides polygyrus TaxID=6339 RepID=A0A183GU90_HELPZ|nr:unnamed protein product [Heligmosomoides polygyrus]